MTDRADRNAGAEVEVLFSGIVPKVGTTAFYRHDGESSVGRKNVVLEVGGGAHDACDGMQELIGGRVILV